MPRNPKVAGQILSIGGQRVFLRGETLADACDLRNWDVVEDTMRKYTPEEDAERHAKLETWERDLKANPPKRIV